MILVIYPIFLALAGSGHVMIIAWIYVFTLIVVITFAIEIKQPGIEAQLADMLRKYNMAEKTVVTSFKFDCIRVFKEYAPEFHVGFLTKVVTDEIIAYLKTIGGEELCPKADLITPENVIAWHREGLNVRAWGVTSQEVMEMVYDAGADGMTVNFPDKLTAYIQLQTEPTP